MELDPDFLLIRICTQEKESYPDKRTRIRNTDLRDSTSEEPSVKCEVLNMKGSNQSYCEERHPNNNFYRHTINNVCTRSCSVCCQRRLLVVAGCLRAELGTRQPCRDNLTMLSGHKMVDYCLMSIFAVETFSYFSCPWCSITLSHCRDVVVAYLKIVACPALLTGHGKHVQKSSKSPCYQELWNVPAHHLS